MRIGSVGGAGGAGAVSFQTYQPYIYNTNTVSGKSLSKVQPIGDNLLSSKTDFSGLTKEENINPLGRGETAHFADVVAIQMQMGRMNAERVMKPAEKAVELSGSEGRMPDSSGTDVSLYQMRHAAQAYQINMAV